MRKLYCLLSFLLFLSVPGYMATVKNIFEEKSMSSGQGGDTASSRETIVEGVCKEGFRGLRSIVDPESQACIGHFLTYKNGSGVEVVLFDDDLHKTHQFDLPSSYGGTIGPSAYNGAAVAVIVYTAAGSFRLFSFTPDGTIIGQETFGYSSEFTGVELFPSVADGGFYLLVQVKNNGTTGYQVLKLSQELKTLWDQKRFPDRGYLIADAAVSLPSQIVVIQRESKEVGLFGDDKVQPDLVCFDGANGDMLFTSPLYDRDYLAVPNQLLADRDGNIVMAGEYYEGQKMKTSNSDGVFFKKLSAAGDVITYNRSSWKEGIQKQLAKTKLKLTGKNKVYFHNLTPTDDGGYQVIAETFSTSAGRKLLSAGLSLLGGDYEKVADKTNELTCQTALSSGRYLGKPTEKEAPMTISTQDFLVLYFDSEGELEEVSKVEKEYTKVFVYEPYMYLGGLKLARLINEYGFMDYAFCVKPEGSEQVVLVANCAYASRKHFAIVTIRKGEEKKVRKISFREIGVTDDGRKPDFVNATPGAGGSMVVYYLIKGKDGNSDELHMYKEKITDN